MLRRVALAVAVVAGCAPGEAPTVVRVHYPAGTRALTLRAVDQQTDRALVRAGDVFTLTLDRLSGPLDFRAWLSGLPSLGAAVTVRPGETVDLYPRFTTTEGRVVKQWDLRSNILGNTRPVWVYLPPTYAENPHARFPVLYMHDGQNLFDPAIAYGGNPWWVQRTCDAAAASGAFDEWIVVAPENTADRTDEYTPVVGKEFYGGKGGAYLRMLVEELKPMVDAELRTRPGRTDTAMLGSSLGGLISAYAGLTHADTFGRIGAMSPSTWWADRVIVSLVAQSPSAPRPLRVYLDSGDAGVDDDDVVPTAQLADAYRAIGFREGVDFLYVVEHGAVHHESAWARRLPEALKFLLGPVTQGRP